jgi:hypothetical protein
MGSSFSWIHYDHLDIYADCTANFYPYKKLSFAQNCWQSFLLYISTITTLLFFVARAGYLRNIKTEGETEALASMGFSGIPDMFYISILYGLGIYYKKKTSFHLRFFASIGLMILGPGLGRFLIAVCGFKPMIAIPVMICSIALIALVWMITDVIKKRSAFPMAVFLGIIAITFVIGPNSHSAWWQAFAKWIAVHLF